MAESKELTAPLLQVRFPLRAKKEKALKAIEGRRNCQPQGLWISRGVCKLAHHPVIKQKTTIL